MPLVASVHLSVCVLSVLSCLNRLTLQVLQIWGLFYMTVITQRSGLDYDNNFHSFSTFALGIRLQLTEFFWCKYDLVHV